MMYPWPGWASYGLVPGERWPGQLLTLSVYLLCGALLLHYVLLPRLARRRMTRRLTARERTAAVAPQPAAPVTEVAAVEDDTATVTPLRPGKYNMSFDWER